MQCFIAQNSKATLGVTTQGHLKQSTFRPVTKLVTFGGNDLMDYGVTNKNKGKQNPVATPMSRIGKLQTVAGRMNRSNKRRKLVGGNRMGGQFGNPSSKGGKMTTLKIMHSTAVTSPGLISKAKFSTLSQNAKPNRRSTSNFRSTQSSNQGKCAFQFYLE